MRLAILLVADYANITIENKLNVMGIFTDIHARNFPARHGSMQVVMQFVAELGDVEQAHRLAVKLVDADRNPIVGIEGPFQVPSIEAGRERKSNVIINFADVVFPSIGSYEFTVELDGEEVKGGRWSIHASSPPAPAAGD